MEADRHPCIIRYYCQVGGIVEVSVFTRQDFRTGLLDTLLNPPLHPSSKKFFNLRVILE